MVVGKVKKNSVERVKKFFRDLGRLLIVKPINLFKNKKIFRYGLSIAAVTFLFSISQNLSARSELAFRFSSYAGGIVDETASPLIYETLHQGIIVNHSQVKNTIIDIGMVVWENENKRDRVLRDSMGPTKMIDEKTGLEIKLPLIIEGKEAVKVQIFNNFIFDDVDKKLITTGVSTEPGSPFVIPKYRYELIFTDINGNEFTQTGKLINRDVINLNWTLSNVCGKDRFNILLCIWEHIKILYVKFFFVVRNFFHWFGLENLGNDVYELFIPNSWVIRI